MVANNTPCIGVEAPFNGMWWINCEELPMSVGHRGLHEWVVPTLVVCGCLLCLGLVGLIIWAHQRARSVILRTRLHAAAYEASVASSIDAAIASSADLQFACALISAHDFKALGRLYPHEELRDRGILHFHDKLAELANSPGKFIFFSHQWTAWDAPDPTNVQFECMVAAVDVIIEANGYSIGETWVWVDFLSIPQRCRGMQQLAINSLPMYTSVANAFCIVAPPLTHADTKQLCDLQAYNRRLWCRTENFCHIVRHGCHDIWVSTSSTTCSKLFARKGDVADDSGEGGEGGNDDGGGRAFLQQNLRVFEGDCTVESDKLQLMSPFLGLYAEVYALAYAQLAASQDALVEGSLHPESSTAKVSWVMSELMRNKDAIFPPTITMRGMDAMTGKEVVKKVTLFGELLSRVEKTIRRNAATRELLLKRHFSLIHAIDHAAHPPGDRTFDLPDIVPLAKSKYEVGRFSSKLQSLRMSTEHRQQTQPAVAGDHSRSTAVLSSTSIVEVVARHRDVELAVEHPNGQGRLSSG